MSETFILDEDMLRVTPAGPVPDLSGEPVERGGPGSGHHGHKGRPGSVGGSLPRMGNPIPEKPGFNYGGAWDLIESLPKTERWDIIREAYEVTDSVHFAPVPDGVDPLPWRETRALSKGGSFRWGVFGPLDIAFNLQTGGEHYGNYPMLNAVHEYGHFMDMLLGTSQDPTGYFRYLFGSKTALTAAGLRDPLIVSAYQELFSVARASDGVQQLAQYDNWRWTDSRGYQHETNQASALKWLSTVEIFARSYTQWVAERSGNERLQGQVRGWREAWRDGGGPDLQWDTDDFQPIGEAMDNLFKVAGLLK
jgi:hypothetical protein